MAPKGQGQVQVKIVCPSCEKSYTIDSEIAEGRKIRCSFCNYKFAYPGEELRKRAFKKEKKSQKAPVESQNNVVIGKVVGGCKIVEKIGKGGMGAVFKGHHINLDIPVAVKFLPKSFARKSKKNIDRFIQEARSAARLQHQHIIGVLNVGFDRGLHYIIMQYVEGEDLRKMIRKVKTFEQQQALRIISQVCLALEAARLNKIVHRDIKLSNIMIDKNGTVKLADLGLATSSEGADEDSNRSSVTGTPQYISPEQSLNPRAVDHRADIYSLGCTLFYMVCGELPYKSSELGELLEMHRTHLIPQACEVNPEVSRDVSDMIAKMMAKSPDDRFQTAGELKTHIEELLAGKSSIGLRIKDLHASALKNAGHWSEKVVLPGPVKVMAMLVGALVVVNALFFFIDQGNWVPGLKAEVYEGKFQKMPDFSKLKPMRWIKVDQPLLNAISGLNKGKAIVFSGRLSIKKTSVFKVFLASDDGSILYLDGKKILDNDGTHFRKEMSVKIRMKEGDHDFRLEYFNGPDPAHVLSLMIEGEGLKKRMIPASMFFHREVQKDGTLK